MHERVCVFTQIVEYKLASSGPVRFSKVCLPRKIERFTLIYMVDTYVCISRRMYIAQFPSSRLQRIDPEGGRQIHDAEMEAARLSRSSLQLATYNTLSPDRKMRPSLARCIHLVVILFISFLSLLPPSLFPSPSLGLLHLSFYSVSIRDAYKLYECHRCP